MGKENNKNEEWLKLPLWYLQIDSKLLKYQRIALALMMYVVFGFYILIPLISTEYQIKIEDVYTYYIIFYVFYSIVGYLVWKFLFKKYELNTPELFAHSLFRVYRSLKKVHLDSNLETSLKKDVRLLVKEMKIIKRKHLNPATYQNLINSLSVCIKNLYKINTSDKNNGYNLDIARKLYIMSEKVYWTKSIDAIDEELQKFSKNLENYPRIRITDKALSLKETISDNFQIYGIFLMIIFIISIYAFPDHQLVLSVFLIGIFPVWLSRFIKK